MENKLMKNLFSPWRSEYIDSFKKPKKNDKFILCSIAQKKE
jgi:hypothetical protein